MLCTTHHNPYIKKNGGRSICVPAPFQYPENKCFRSTYFGLTHEIPQPIGLCTCRSRYVTPLGGVVPSHRSHSVEWENWFEWRSFMKETNTHVSLYLNNSLNHSKLNELLPRHQQSSVKCLTIPVPMKWLPEMTPDNFFLGDGGVFNSPTQIDCSWETSDA